MDKTKAISLKLSRPWLLKFDCNSEFLVSIIIKVPKIWKIRNICLSLLDFFAFTPFQIVFHINNVDL